MATCANCGTQHDSDVVFCPQCGEQVRSETDAPRTDGVGNVEPTQSPTTTDGEPHDETDEGGAMLSLASYEKFVYSGAILTVLGAFLPWASFMGMSVLGIEGDGILTLLMGIIAAGIVWWKPWGRRIQIAVTALGGLICLIGLVAFTSAAAIGLYMTLVGGVVLVYVGGRELVDIT